MKLIIEVTEGYYEYLKERKDNNLVSVSDITILDGKSYEERPIGKWEYNQYDGNLNIGNWHCSECRHIIFGGYSQKPYYNFCPNCGADMREEAHNE